jgi:hypothetical protein
LRQRLSRHPVRFGFRRIVPGTDACRRRSGRARHHLAQHRLVPDRALQVQRRMLGMAVRGSRVLPARGNAGRWFALSGIAWSGGLASLLHRPALQWQHWCTFMT